MDTIKRISKVYNTSEKIPYDNASRIILMSDCHRGDGNWSDDFSNNQNLYFTALNHYYKSRFTYIELGDGDELWKNKKFSDIVRVHSDVFWLLSKFYEEGRAHFLYGNHDAVKADKNFVSCNLFRYYDERNNKYIPLFKNVKMHEGLILENKETGKEIFLIHGNQGEFINDSGWKLGRFLVRHLWKPLELYGVRDPTRTAINYEKQITVSNKLVEWVTANRTMLIAGHTHKPVFPEPNEAPYYNDGSCVHPRCITGIEIVEGSIQLIKWSVKTKPDGVLYVDRDILAGPRQID